MPSNRQVAFDEPWRKIFEQELETIKRANPEYARAKATIAAETLVTRACDTPVQQPAEVVSKA